jgi:leucyl/phenylalanyl-tRNA--protein transferase
LIHKTYSYSFPDPLKAPSEGLVAWGGDLNPKRVLSAYKMGIFPWYSEDDPILWWSPDPRLILYPHKVKISKSLKKSIRRYHVRIDSDFDSVINRCRSSRIDEGEGTWILDEVIECYRKLFEMGYIKSFEVYEDEELVGGLYGVNLGRIFCGESMFSLKRDSSKVALVYLCQYCMDNNYKFIDCQVPSSHLISMGAETMSRSNFIELLQTL